LFYELVILHEIFRRFTVITFQPESTAHPLQAA
jgi:hypothetical protein